MYPWYHKWVKSKKILLEVLEDRGYNVTSIREDFEEFLEDEDNLPEEDSLMALKEKLEVIVEGEQGKILLHWSESPKLGTNVRNVYLKMLNTGVKKAIVVVDDSVTPNSKTTLKGIKKSGYSIDVYTLNEAQYNVTKHKLQPFKFEICTPEEKKMILRKYAVKQNQIPGMKTTDPIVRHFGAKRGDMFKILRKSRTQGDRPALTYRIVV